VFVISASAKRYAKPLQQKANICLFFYGLLLAAMPFRCFAVCHTLLRSASFLTAAIVSFMPLHSFRPRYASLHHVRSHKLFQGMASRPAQKQCNARMHMPFTSQRYYTHWVPFRYTRPSFTLAPFSPPAAHVFARLACLPQLRVCHCFYNRTNHD
jgi:hypothetical protein